MVTKSDSFRDKPEFRVGRAGEREVATVLQHDGWHVIASYDYVGEDEKAPRLHGAQRHFVIPDLDVSRDGRRIWIEVKTKSRPTEDRFNPERGLEHGIPLRHYRDYQEVQEITGCEVCLVIVERNTGQRLIASLDELRDSERFYLGDKMSPGGMVFFPRSRFTLGLSNA